METIKENIIWQSENRQIRLPFTDMELMMFAMVYRELLKKTKKENIFEWIELIPQHKLWWNIF